MQTAYRDKVELASLFKGIEPVLCSRTVHLDPGSETQKGLIDAFVEAGVKRFVPSRMGSLSSPVLYPKKTTSSI